MLPTDHVIADPVPPMNLMPEGPGRIVLIEQMILAIVIKRRMGFIHPMSGRQSMILRPVAVAVINGRIDTDLFICDFWDRISVGLDIAIIGLSDFFFRQG